MSYILSQKSITNYVQTSKNKTLGYKKIKSTPSELLTLILLLTFNYPSLFTSHHYCNCAITQTCEKGHHAGPHSKHTFHYSLRPRRPVTYRGGRPRVSPLPRVTSPVNKVWTHSLPPEFTVQLQQIAGSQQEKNSPQLIIFFLFNSKIACKPFPDLLLFSLLLG